MLPSADPFFFDVPREAEQELGSTHAFYAALAAVGFDAEHGMGGKLLYAGALDPDACRLVRAANIAGAASLAAVPDPAEAKQAMREGVIDFLVTTLDESLRILKNEIRKHQPVAVAVSLPVETVTAQMIERGVLPDLVPQATVPAEAFLAQGARRLPEACSAPGTIFTVLRIPRALFQRAAKLDELLAAYLPADDEAGRRWLRLSPRYVERSLRSFRSFVCNVEIHAQLLEEAGRLLLPRGPAA
jgi:hypothetical protein